jgi:hypothetical protein
MHGPYAFGSGVDGRGPAGCGSMIALLNMVRTLPGEPPRRVSRNNRFHSARSAITGSISVARRAGNHDAPSATSSKSTDSAA